MEKDLNDKLLDAMQAGDYEKLIALGDNIIYYHLHLHGLWNLFPNDRDDLLQEGRIALLRCVKTYKAKDKQKFSTYAHAAVRNALFFYVKKMKLYDTAMYSEINETYQGSDDETMKSFSMTDYYIDKYAKRPKTADILRRYFINGETQVSIAESYNMSQQTINSTVKRFKEKVKKNHGNK